MITEVSDTVDVDAAARILEQSLWARIIALDQYSVDATRKSEQQFWDVYRGCEDVWYTWRYRAISTHLGRSLEYGSHASARGSIGGVEHCCLPTTTRDILTRKFHFR